MSDPLRMGAEWLRGGPPPSDLRIGDAERSEVADLLSKHYSDGRLDQAEFDERLEKALHAKTRADLAPLLADLPRLVPAGEAHETPPPARRGPRRLVGLVAVVVIVVVAFNAVGHLVLFPHLHAGWLVVAAAALLVLRRRHRRGYRRAPLTEG